MWCFTHIVSPPTGGLGQGMEKKLVQLDFSAVMDRVSHSAMLYTLSYVGVGGQFLSIVLEFISDRRQHVRLDGKVSASVDVASEVPQGNVLRPLLFLLYTSELFRIIGNYIVG